MSGNNLRAAAAALAALLAAASPASAQKPWTLAFTANTGSWSAPDLDYKGTQTVEYMQISRVSPAWGFAATGKFVNTNHTSPAGGENLKISSLTQTNIATYFNAELGAVTLRAGLDADLPTGKNSYTDAEIERLITGNVAEDLMLINVYGEGTNISPHLTVAVALGQSFSIGLGAKREFTGKYDITKDTEGDELDPGDRTLIMANAALKLGGAGHLLLSASMAWAGYDKQAGAPVYQQGDLKAAELRWINSSDAGARVIVSMGMKSQSPNKTLSETNKLALELFNSNNNSVQAFAAVYYPLSGRLAALGMGGYKSVAANGYSADSPLYDGGRTVAFLEPGVKWSPTEALYVTFKARYSAIKGKKDAFAGKDAAYSVTNLDLGMAWAF